MPADGPKATARLEAFSDGVFAIAITLLVLLVLERPPGEEVLLDSLLHAWPSYLAFVLSFLTILVMWVNHSANLAHVERADGRLLFCNGFLLLFVTLLPFPTAVLAEHLAGDGARLAAGVYAGTFVAINLAWIAFWRAIVAGRAFLAPGLPDHEVRAFNGALATGLASYLAAMSLAWVSAAASVSLCLALTLFWTWRAMRHHGHGHLHGGPAR